MSMSTVTTEQMAALRRSKEAALSKEQEAECRLVPRRCMRVRKSLGVSVCMQRLRITYHVRGPLKGVAALVCTKCGIVPIWDTEVF